ncbi:CpaF family protein [Methylocystis parvus]|uniref:CpaF family protein n=1 Tax=Methylocystis parvus TaxID=134 RepID=UPI003C73CDD2
MSERFKFFTSAPKPLPAEETPTNLPVPAEMAGELFGDPRKRRLLEEKVILHGKIIDEFNLAFLDQMSRDDLRRSISEFVFDYIKSKQILLNQSETEAFLEEIIDEMVGLGPLQSLLDDPTINDILINTENCVFVERQGLLQKTEVRFKDEAHLLRVINKIVSRVGRRVDESSPMVDARLLDGSRVNVAVKPIAVDGPLVSIRKFSKRPYSIDRLEGVGALKHPMSLLLQGAVRGRISMVISGGTGSGKTTMLNALSASIPPTERILTIEDAAELQLQQPHVARLECRPANAEGKGEIRQRELVKNALRMRPDRIIIGECRGEEAFDMLQAMNTGHEGSMTTIHANTPRDALRRLEQMVGMASVAMAQQSIRQQIASAIQVIVQLQRLSDGSRRVVSISEVTGMESDIIQLQEIYRFVREGIDANGAVVGSFRATGIRPLFLESLKYMGVDFPASAFDPNTPL